ncbi:HET-domain-containing protein [Lepidopterella palustris CBS 459.81]|uniref:HET-domain-containing protein n=1 Tax=Lepidopterella palustris CBS 459.81 TaxID=1314670 RepID=A0A8E2JBI6_9PEZI|nr:HET-domain-containing protein [Lepidopterella palustris CBS 459.81]
MAANCKINLSEVSVAEKDCQLCALLLRTVKRHYNDEQQNVQIVRERSALKIGAYGPRILRLCSDLEHSVDNGEGVQISFPALPEAEGPERFALFRAWLRWCDESHSCNKNDVETKSALPTRLLYVGDPNPEVLRLYCPKNNDRVEYVALSHCWGKLTYENKHQFCTTDDNIEARLKGFSLSELPKTFLDAVRVTRELGIEYLWIDSLCIIQWNQKDWEHEAKRMEGVFASAYCTIAATSAHDSNAGFLNRNACSQYVYAQGALGQRLYVCTDVGDFENDVEKGGLNTRAWALQERVLSRRTFHFGANQAYFECGNGVYCEDLTIMESPIAGPYFLLDPNFPHRLLALSDKRTAKFIHFLCSDYSKRSLTEETDRCVAISGLEDRIARAIECRSSYGIFEQYIHRNLLWYRDDDNKTKRIEYKTQIVPSWSWMAYNGGINFIGIPFEGMEWIENLRFDEKDNYALVTDIGAFRSCNLKRRDVLTRRDAIYVDIMDMNQKKRGMIAYDTGPSEDLHLDQCVVVGRENRKDEQGLWFRNYFMLVVRPTGVDGEYRRVGVGRIESDYVVRQRLNVRVV